MPLECLARKALLKVEVIYDYSQAIEFVAIDQCHEIGKEVASLFIEGQCLAKTFARRYEARSFLPSQLPRQ